MPPQTLTPFQRLLRNNDLGIIENPLLRIDEEELEKDSTNFHLEYLTGVVDLNVLHRGGRLARNGEEVFREIEHIDRVESQALDKEKRTTFWQESKELKVILLTCTVASVVQGWVQGSIVGANQGWPAAFGLQVGLNGVQHPTFRTIDIWQFGAVNSIVYFAASSVGAILCDPLTEVFWGRRGALFVAGIMTFTGSVGSAFTHSWRALFGCRFLLGIGMGAKSSIVPVYLSEISPARLRGLSNSFSLIPRMYLTRLARTGQILVSWQTGTALGIALAGAVNLIANGSWRFQIGSSFIPSAMLLVLVFVGSESPRWLAKKQRFAEAYNVLLRLRESPLLAARDLVSIRAHLRIELFLFKHENDMSVDLESEVPDLDAAAFKKEVSLSGYGRRIIQLFTIPRVRRSTLAAFIVMMAQQLSGVNIFAFLAATLFDSAGISHISSLWLYFGFGLANFV